jgi:ferrous iron transport protein B
VLDRIGALGALSRAARPVVTGALGLPADAAEVFVMGFLRRDYGAAGLFKMAQNGSLTAVQSVVALTVMTLFVPCVANLLMIIRERGLRTGLAILVAVTIRASDVSRHRVRVRPDGDGRRTRGGAGHPRRRRVR